jgi:hypothetical protein
MYSAKVTLKYDATWEQTRGIYAEEMIPEEHFTFEVPAEDLNTIQLFQLFEKFCYAMGHNSVGIAKGAAYIAFNDMRSFEDMKKTADEYDLVMSEDYTKKVSELEAEVRDLKAKLSRLENPDNPNYTEDEMEAMSHEVADALLNKLQGAYTVCKDCGSKYGEYSVGCSSVWEGECNVCGETKPVTEARDYGYLNKGINLLLGVK